MLKRFSLLLLLLLVALPTAASAWQLSTRVNTTGGTLQVRNGTLQGYGSAVLKNYTTHQDVPITLAADTGYRISTVQIGSAYVSPLPTNNPQVYLMGLVQYPTKNSQSIGVWFTKQLIAVTAAAGAGGTVSPSGTLNPQYGTNVSYTFTPGAGKNVIAITGLPAEATLMDAATSAPIASLPGAVNRSVKASFTVPASPVTMTGVFLGVTANASAAQVTPPGSIVTLDASGSVNNAGIGSLTYAWAQTGGPGVTLNDPGAVKPTFLATATGICSFQVTVSNGTSSNTAYTSVTVTTSAAAAARNQCENCHQPQNIGASASVFARWSSSKHAQPSQGNPNMCYDCHTGSNTGGHPGTVNATTVNPATFTLTGPANGFPVGSNFCAQCHSNADQIVSWYNASPHPQHTNGPTTCAGCHVDPHAVISTTAPCIGCHVDSYGNVAGHPIAIGDNSCIVCHNPHSTVASMTQGAPHFNNITSGMYPASYMASRAHCSDCHTGDATNATRRHEWAQSSHAATTDLPWVYYDFKTRSGCVQCHTTTGFIAYSTGKVTAAWGSAADKTKEVLACNGCHQNIVTGSIRTVTPISPYAGDAYINRNVGESNICMDCHSGTNNGLSITAKLNTIPPGDFTSQAFIAPHYLAAGGTLHGKAGYQVSGQNYAFYSTNTHRTIGIGNTKGTGIAGPCIACHKNPVNGHTFVAGFQNGVIPVCANCHGTSLDATKLAGDKAAFTNALDVLKAQLAAKGFTFFPTYPYFTDTNWGHDQAGADTMGAAFNYVLLIKEPGAYAHNSAYARQLILDAIDHLDDGSINGSVEKTVQAMADTGAISQAQADSFIAYKSASACTSCHGGPANTSAPMATNAHPAHLTSGYGPAPYLGNDVPACQACHPYPNGHANGTADVLNGTGSACAGCHPGTIPAWDGGARLACTSCHGATPSVLPNGVAAPAKANFTTAGHGQFVASNQCTNCHDANSSHINGTLGTTSRLLTGLTGNLNAECKYCHNDAAKVSAQFRNMSTHFITKGGAQAMACSTCHDPHGTTNLSMIRTSINGQTITYVDRSTGLIDTTTNQGLCQACHTATNHYRAGIPETAHPTENCLGCHPHNAATGAFKPNGTCDACHGYPPAPRTAISSVTFGTMNNWSSARFEDYSGGGGAHLVAQHVSPSAKPSEGWANCTICHNGGKTISAPYHRMTLPLKNHVDNVHMEVDPAYRFDNSFTIYTGAKLLNPPARNTTGSCFNISCHMSPSPRWSIER